MLNRAQTNKIHRDVSRSHGHSGLVKYVALKTRLKETTVRKVYNAMVEYIYQELQTQGSARLMNLCAFTVVPTGDKIRKMYGKEIYVPLKYIIRYHTSQKAIDALNGTMEEDEYQKNGKLVKPNSRERAKRLESVDNLIERRASGERLDKKQPDYYRRLNTYVQDEWFEDEDFE